jgi:hypothetical protein
MLIIKLLKIQVTAFIIKSDTFIEFFVSVSIQHRMHWTYVYVKTASYLKLSST